MILRAVILITCALSASCMANSEVWNAYIRKVSNADRFTLRELHAGSSQQSGEMLSGTSLINRMS